MLTTLLLVLLGAAAGAVLVMAALIYLFQHRLIYHPTPYHSGYMASFPERTRELRFETTDGKQTAFYVPPSRPPAGGKPDRLWVLFGGNGSVAINWVGWLREPADPAAGFLLVDYPGYGLCEGSPSPEGILRNSEGAFAALAAELGVPPAELEKGLSVLGHSLGAAAALQFAVRHPVQRVVLVAPFTSMREMARRVVGRPMSLLLRHHFENEERLEELARRTPPPQVLIVHGDSDNVVPVEMGRRLAEKFPGLVTYVERPQDDHVSVLDCVDGELCTPPRR